MKTRRHCVVASVVTVLAFLFPFAASAGDGAPPAGTSPAAGTAASDPEIDAILTQIEAFTQNGTFPGETHQTWWKSNLDPFINAYSQDTGLSQNVVTWILLGETEGEGALSTVNTALEQFGLVCATYDVVKNLAEGRQDLAFYTTAKTVLSDLLGRLGRSGKLSAASLGIIDYALTTFGETAVADSNQFWWEAYLDFQTRGERTDDFWIQLFLKDGFPAVAREADRFWDETEHRRGIAFFRTNNKNCVADYRARFMRHYLLPRLQGWLAAEKDIRRREAADRCRELREALARATFRVMGAVVNTATKSSARRMNWRVRLCRPDGRELAREKVSDSDHFKLVGDLKDIPDGQFRVLVELADEATDAPDPTAEVMAVIGRPAPGQTAPLEIERTGYNVRVRLHDIPVNAYVKRAEPPPPPRDLWTVPSPLPDELPQHEALLEALWQQYQAGRLPLELFGRAAERELRGAAAAFRECDGRLVVIGQALEHNRRRLMHPLVRPGSMEEGEVAPDVAARIDNEFRPKIAAAQAAERDYRQKWSELEVRWRDRLSQAFNTHQRKLAEAEQALRSAQAAAQPVIAEYMSAREEAYEQLQAWEHAREAVAYDDRTGGLRLAADDLGRIEALGADGVARFQAVAQKIESADGRLRDAMGPIEEKQRVVSQLLAEGYGVPLNSPAQLFARVDGDTIRCEQAAEEVAAVQRMIQEARVPEKLQRGAESFKRLAARKRAQMTEAAALLQQLEQAVARCPDEAALKLCAQHYAQLTAGVDAGLMAYRRALAGDMAPVLPKEVCDEQGDDTAFWRRQAAAIAQFARDQADIIGDLLPLPARQATALGDAIQAGGLVADRRADLTAEQSAKVDELLRRVWSLSDARAGSALGGIGRQWPAVKFLADAGLGVAQRWAALVAANQQLQDRAARTLAAALRLPRCAQETPETAVRSAYAQAVDLLRPLSTEVLPANFVTVDTLDQIGQAQAAIAGSGVWAAIRRVENRPDAPAELTVHGQKVRLDGRCVRLRQAECGPKLEIGASVVKGLRSEYSWSGRDFYRVDPATGRLDDMMIRPAPVPIVLRLFVRVSLPDGSATSQLPDEPPLTIALVP